jgi:hypothetical protein
MPNILYPPRPKGKINPARLSKYEQSEKWICQRKFNGTHVVVHVPPDRRVSILTRHGTPPKLFSLSQNHIQQILNLNFEKGKDYWLAGELLDHKTTDQNYKRKIVFFDVLQAGRYLIGRPDQMGRLALLDEICQPDPGCLEPTNGIALQLSPNIWMAEWWDQDFMDRFNDFIDLDEIEGLVLRKKGGAIDNFGTREYDVTWMLRCRKPHSGGNYEF